MDAKTLKILLKEVRTGRRSVEDAAARLADLPYADMGIAKIDHHRALRCGFGEVIFGAGKTPIDTIEIVARVLRHAPMVLVTRASDAHIEALSAKFPNVHANAKARTVRVGAAPKNAQLPGFVAVVSAGTSDQPVAEEAVETLEAFGANVERFYDVGVAGLHRLLHTLPRLKEARAAIVVAGMEGALPSVVGGLLACPLVAVPTSIGYGASFNGIAALLAMLNSCAAGVSVVNIDNGFGAAAAVLRMLQTGGGKKPASRKRKAPSHR